MEDTGTSVGAGSGGVAATSLVPSDGGDSDGGRDDALPVLPGWAANFFITIIIYLICCSQ